MYFRETYCSYSVLGQYDTDGLFKVMGSEIKVADISQKNTLFQQRHISCS